MAPLWRRWFQLRSKLVSEVFVPANTCKILATIIRYNIRVAIIPAMAIGQMAIFDLKACEYVLVEDSYIKDCCQSEVTTVSL